MNNLHLMDDFAGQTVAITGGAGILGGAMAFALAEHHAKVAIIDRAPTLAELLLKRIQSMGGEAFVVEGDVCEAVVFQKAVDAVIAKYGKIDCLINGAGGNNPKATTNPELSFFQLPTEAIEFVMRLNIVGTILPSQIVGRHMAERKEGVILNISSMNAFRPLTRIPAYSAAKAAVSNFTQWLAVHMAQEYSPAIRVNAIAPGFFLTEQNRFLLTDMAMMATFA